MTKLTRRGLLGGTAAAATLAACGRGDEVPVAERPDVRTDSRAPYAGRVSYEHGVASGDPLQSSVIIWTRVTPVTGDGGTIPVAYGVFEDEALERPIIFGLATAEPGRDHTVKVDLEGLQPGREYWYRFVAKDETGDVGSTVGRTKTLPARGAEDPVKFAFLSCSNYPFGLFNVYGAVAERRDLDCIIHLGDYIYEYGIDGYGSETGAAIGRMHEPVTETVTLGDYRMRHAQYKADPQLQAAHAVAPWLCTWDDHESANNSYRNGAQNHNPEANEGDWTERKQTAVQAYLEWMPVREPEAGRARDSIYRRFDFGKTATVFCLESRLTGRSDEISWFNELGGKEPAEIPMAAANTMMKVQDESRTMLGSVQEEWLADGLKDSVRGGVTWQVLANQTIMAKVKPPALQRTLTPEQIDAQTGYGRQLVDFSVLGLPWNLDAWDGFPAARDRLYAAVDSAKARLVTLTGDTHTSWANTLLDKDGDLRGVEFGCTSVTSPGFGTYMTGVPDLGEQFADANDEVKWYRPEGHGYTLVNCNRDEIKAEWFEVSTILDASFSTDRVKAFRVEAEAKGVGPLTEIV